MPMLLGAKDDESDERPAVKRPIAIQPMLTLVMSCRRRSWTYGAFL